MGDSEDMWSILQDGKTIIRKGKRIQEVAEKVKDDEVLEVPTPGTKQKSIQETEDQPDKTKEEVKIGTAGTEQEMEQEMVQEVAPPKRYPTRNRHRPD